MLQDYAYHKDIAGYDGVRISISDILKAHISMPIDKPENKEIADIQKRITAIKILENEKSGFCQPY